jgi:hypothetical protein
MTEEIRNFGKTGAEAGRNGGKRSLETMTPEARRERARKANAAKAAKAAARKAEQDQGS